jgi:hypothetical protein
MDNITTTVIPSIYNTSTTSNLIMFCIAGGLMFLMFCFFCILCTCCFNKKANIIVPDLPPPYIIVERTPPEYTL